MNRRELLVASAASAFVVSGCVDRLDPRNDGSGDADDVQGCTQPDPWSGTITAGPADPEPDSIAGRRDCANATRPQPTGDVCETFVREGDDGEETVVHSAGVEPYPNQPSAFDEETLRSFVPEYERAYTQNAAVSRHGRNVVEFSFNTNETRTIDISNGITTIVVEFGFGYRVEGNGYTDAFGEVAVYDIDETGVVRADAAYSERGQIDPDELPNPIEDGDLLECF